MVRAARDKVRSISLDQSGFTLIELLVVIVILAILIAIAVPAYLNFKSSAQDAASKSNVRSAIPAAEQMNITNGSYSGITGASLRTSTPGIGANVMAVAVSANAGYCLEDNEGNGAWHYVGGTPPSGLVGPSATIVAGTCLAAVGTAAT